jgi:hypothetical protein
MKRFLMNVAATLRRPGRRHAPSPMNRQARPQVECLQERLLPSSAPIFTGDTFYVGNHTAQPDRLIISWESPGAGLSTRYFTGLYLDDVRGLADWVGGSITATGAVTPGSYGVPISTITFSGTSVGGFSTFFESVSFTGQVYGSGYSPNGGCQFNSIDGTLSEWGWLGRSGFWSSSYVSGNEGCIS